MDALDTHTTYENCLGTVVSWKGGAGYIDWFTEDDMPIKIKFLSNEKHVTDKQHVHFTAQYNSSTSQWIAIDVGPASFIEGIVYSSPDKNLVIKYGKRQIHYRILPGDHVIRSIRVRPGDRVKFLPACSVFAEPPFYFAAKPDLLAHGIIDCVVQDHGKDTGVYIKWRVCEDVNNERPSEERIFHMFRVAGESKFLRPGLKVMLTPVLLIKKTTGRLNLTSVFGTLVCFAEATVTETPTTVTKRGGHILPGKARLVAPHHGMIVEFYKENVETPDSPRPLRQGDKVQIQMRGDIETTSIDITILLIIEGTVVNNNGNLEILENTNGEERHWKIDPDKEEAVLGYLPLQEGDLVRCTINSRNYADNVKVLSEVEGKVHALNLLLLRGSTVAVFKPKNPRAFKVGDSVLAHLEWAETHYRALDARLHNVNPPSIARPPSVLDQSHILESHTRTSPTLGRSPPRLGSGSSKSAPGSPGPSSLPSPTLTTMTPPLVPHNTNYVPRLALSNSAQLSNHSASIASPAPIVAPTAMRSPPVSPAPPSAAQLMGEQDLDRLVDAIAKLEATQLGSMMDDVEDTEGLSEYDEVIPGTGGHPKRALPHRAGITPTISPFQTSNSPIPASHPDTTYDLRSSTDMISRANGMHYATPSYSSALQPNAPAFVPPTHVAASSSPHPFSTPFTGWATSGPHGHGFGPTIADTSRVDWGSTLFLPQYYLGQPNDLTPHEPDFMASVLAGNRRTQTFTAFDKA